MICSPLVISPEVIGEVDYQMTPVFVEKEEVSWSLWYVGVQYSGLWLKGQVAEEYEKGTSLGGVVGFILPDGFGLELGLQTGRFAGTPKFDYVTTSQYANGDMSVTKEIPERMSATATSAGVKASYQWLQREVGSQIASGWRVGTSLRYVWFSEETLLTQEKFSDGRLNSSRAHNVENFFQRPVLGVELSTTTAVASRWWIDVTAGYEIAGNNPKRILPTVFDWNEYTGQIQLGVSLKVKMGDFPSTQLFWK